MTLVQTSPKKIYMWVDIPPYLCFTANTAGSTVQLTKIGNPSSVTLETSTDGSTWNAYTIGNTITLSAVGDKVYMRNTSETDTGFGKASNAYYKFVMTGSIAGSGEVNYLLNKNSTTSVSNYCFLSLFNGCSSLTTAPSITATNTATLCYGQMFMSCSSLIDAPSLPAMSLSTQCYQQMFAGCTSLVNAPSLPATTLGNKCYYSMFTACSNLETLPSLPATYLPDQCYYDMFDCCSKIKLSQTQTGDYQTPYRIPTEGTGSQYSTDCTSYMFYSTGGTWQQMRVSLNTTYYTSNTVV